MRTSFIIRDSVAGGRVSTIILDLAILPETGFQETVAVSGRTSSNTLEKSGYGIGGIIRDRMYADAEFLTRWRSLFLPYSAKKRPTKKQRTMLP